jgi:hypothetical protein
MWEMYFVGYRNENLEKELFAEQERTGNIDRYDLKLREDIQKCFNVGFHSLCLGFQYYSGGPEFVHVENTNCDHNHGTPRVDK